MTLKKDTVTQPFSDSSKNMNKSLDMKSKKLKTAKKYVSSPLSKPPLEANPWGSEKYSHLPLNDPFNINFTKETSQKNKYGRYGISISKNMRSSINQLDNNLKIVEQSNKLNDNLQCINRDITKNYLLRKDIADTNFPLIQEEYCLSPLTEHTNDDWLPCGLPSYFNPRKASNMHHGEKVDHWIKNLPYWSLNGNEINVQCYNNEYDLDWEEIEFDNVNYNTHRPVIDLIDWEDIVFFQSKKLDALVRKGYMQEKQVVDIVYDMEYNDYPPGYI